MCGQIEFADHIFFTCGFAGFIWSGIRAMINVTWNPTSFARFFQIIYVLSYGHRRLCGFFLWLRAFLFAAQSWALWHIHNKIAMENSFPNQPADCVLKTLLFLQQWRPLFKNKDLAAVEILEELLRQLHRDTRSAPGS
jgi:hypothetical protein